MVADATMGLSLGLAESEAALQRLDQGREPPASLISPCGGAGLLLRVRCKLEPGRNFATCTLPCILHWDLNHFVVLTKRRGAGPAWSSSIRRWASGGCRLARRCLRHFTGVALELAPDRRVPAGGGRRRGCPAVVSSPAACSGLQGLARCRSSSVALVLEALRHRRAAVQPAGDRRGASAVARRTTCSPCWRSASAWCW